MRMHMVNIAHSIGKLQKQINEVLLQLVEVQSNMITVRTNNETNSNKSIYINIGFYFINIINILIIF